MISRKPEPSHRLVTVHLCPSSVSDPKVFPHQRFFLQRLEAVLCLEAGSAPASPTGHACTPASSVPLAPTASQVQVCEPRGLRFLLSPAQPLLALPSRSRPGSLSLNRSPKAPFPPPTTARGSPYAPAHMVCTPRPSARVRAGTRFAPFRAPQQHQLGHRRVHPRFPAEARPLLPATTCPSRRRAPGDGRRPRRPRDRKCAASSRGAELGAPDPHSPKTRRPPGADQGGQDRRSPSSRLPPPLTPSSRPTSNLRHLPPAESADPAPPGS